MLSKHVHIGRKFQGSLEPSASLISKQIFMLLIYFQVAWVAYCQTFQRGQFLRHHMICYKSIESLIETLRASWDCFLKRCFKIYAWRSDFKSVRIWWKRKLQKLNTPFTCQKHALTLYVSHSFERFGYGVKTLNRCLAQHK